MRRAGLVATAIAGAALVGLILGRSAVADEGLRIESLAPACAGAGEAVTITGGGLAPSSLAITVGGAPAELIAVAGQRATFVVPPGVPLGPTTVVASRYPPGQGPGSPRSASMPFQICDVAVPAGWAGQWRFTLTYRDPASGRILAVDRVAAAIRPGDPIGLGLLGGGAECSASASDASVEASCAADLTVGMCPVRATAQFTLARDGETLSGSGRTEAVVGGVCPASSATSIVELQGVRLSAEPGAAPGPGLLQRLVRTPAVRFVRATSFASLAVRTLVVGRQQLIAAGTFELAGESNGIAPPAEEVRIRVGALVATLPAGSFAPLEVGSRSGGVFEGALPDGMTLSVRIQPQADGVFAFTVSAEPGGVDETDAPLLVSLAIGDDSGNASVRPSRVE